MFMTTAAQPVFQTWRELYTAALFEANEDRIPSRIKEAEKAIVARARELFAADADTIEEDQALDDALYALRALQSCLSFARLPNSTRHSRREVFHSVPEGTLLRFVPGPANNDPVAN